MRKTLTGSVPFIVVGLSACGGAAPPVTGPPAPRAEPFASAAAPLPSPVPQAAVDGLGRHFTQPQLRVGHYSSGDGLVGLVLDRSGPSVRVKLDGSEEVLELEVFDRSERRTIFVTRRRTLSLEIRADGAIELSRDGRTWALYRDADAGPLAQGASASAEDSADVHFAQPKLRVGHYSSRDGSVGFVLDRTGKRPRLRLDGTSEVIELETETTSTEHVDLTRHLRGTVIRLGLRGEVTYFRDGRAYVMVRDADADLLQ